MNELQQWWQSLVIRERIIVTVLAVFVALMMFQVMVWNPLHKGQENAANSVQKQTEVLRWMQERAALVAELQRNTPASNSSVKRQSISQRLNSSATQAKVEINRFQTVGDNSVQVWLDQVEFSKLLLWLEIVHNEQEIQTESIVVSETGKAGLVSARMTLVSN